MSDDLQRPLIPPAASGPRVELEKLYELALQGTTDGLWVWDMASNAVWYAPRLRELLGYAGDDEAGFPSVLETFHRHLHPDDHPVAEEALQRHLELGEPYDANYRLRTSTGAWRWFRVRGTCVRNEAGKPVRMAGSMQDVQALQDALASLRVSNERLHQALTNGNVGLWDWDVETNQVHYSPQLKIQLGYGPNEPWDTYLDWESRLHPDDREAAVERVRRYLERKSDEYVSTFRLRCRNGSYRWILSQGEAKWNEHGKPRRMIGVHVDITRQKELEADLQQANAELRREQFLLNALVENTPDPIFFKDRDSRFLRVNQRMAEDVGVNSPTELVGKTDAEAWGGGFWEQTLADERHILETGEPLVNKEENPVSRDGREKWVLVTKLPLRNETGKIVGTFGIARDISALKRHEQDLERINRELARSNEELENFAYVASHDLRTPLRNIDSLTRWILEDAGDVLPAQSKDDLLLLRQRVELMNQLLNDLLQYSRVGRMESEPEWLAPNDVVQEVLELLAPPPTFTIVVQPNMPHLRAPRTALRHVLQNLVDNAIKHHDRPDGRIEISASEQGEFVEFVVRDDGPGIAPRFHRKVFQLFQTLRRRDDGEAGGMGLAVVKKTVETFGGEVSLESEEGAGAVFRFTWRRQQ